MSTKIPVTNLEIDFAETEKRLLDGTVGLAPGVVLGGTSQ